MTNKKPIHEIRFGAIKSAIWENETVNGLRHSVTFSRLYKDGDAWKQADNFRRDELLLLAKVAEMTHTWIYEQGQKEVAPE